MFAIQIRTLLLKIVEILLIGAWLDSKLNENGSAGLQAFSLLLLKAQIMFELQNSCDWIWRPKIEV